MQKKMKIALLMCLTGAGAATTQRSMVTTKAAQPAISQIVITQYTGGGGTEPGIDPIYRIYCGEMAPLFTWATKLI
jgi:hypothetical protein